MSDLIERVKAYRNAHPGISLRGAKNAVERPGDAQCDHGYIVSEADCPQCAIAALRSELDSTRARLAEAEKERDEAHAYADGLEMGADDRIRDADEATARAEAAERERDEAREGLDEAKRRNAEIREDVEARMLELDDWRESARIAAEGGHGDEKHCACIGPLLAELYEVKRARDEVRAYVDGMEMGADDRIRDADEATAARDVAEARLREALGALRGLLAVAWPTTEEGHTGFVDRLGMQFYRETGIWPPFKSAPMEIAKEPTDADMKSWRGWLERKRFDAADSARRALASASETGSGR